MIHQDDRIAIGHQVTHDPREPRDVGRVQADGRLVQHIEHTGGAVAHRPGQLHPLAFTRGQGGRGPVQREIAQSQLHQPPGRQLEGVTDAPGHGTHFLGKGIWRLRHPAGQLRQVHAASLVQGNSPYFRRAGMLGKPGTAAAGTGFLLEEPFHPLHARLVLDLGQGVFHRMYGAVIGEIQLCRIVGVLGLVKDVFLYCRTIVNDILFLLGQIAEGHVRAHAHGPAHIGHQRPHEGFPGQHRPLVNGQGLVGHQGAQVHPAHHARTVALPARALGIEGKFLRAGGIKVRTAFRADQFLSGGHRQGRRQIMPVGAAVAGQAGEHQPQAVEQFCTRAEGAANARHPWPLMQRQRRGYVKRFLHIRPGRLGHPPPGIGGQGLQIAP